MGKIFCITLFFAFLAIWQVRADFVNNWDEYFDFACPGNSIIDYIYSVHDNKYEDRRWEFKCRRVSAKFDCTSSGYINEFDKVLDYQCPGSTVLNGVQSFNNNNYNDRRFSFSCCKVNRGNAVNCYQTGYINDYDGIMNFKVSGNQAIKGFYSVHDNFREDRIWNPTLCDVM